MNKAITCGDFLSLGLIRDLELLASENSCVLWIRNQNYDHQLYLSATYLDLWGKSCLSLYKDPESWLKTLKTKDAEKLYNELKLKRTLICPDYTTIYCVKLPKGKSGWFQDRSFQLPVSGNKTIIAGCALYIPEKKMLNTNQAKINTKLDRIVSEYYKILTSSSHPKEAVSQARNLHILEKLSRREKQLFELFIQGKSTSQVAKILHLSPRTVEAYLINLKTKLACESKSDLIMKAIDNGWLLIAIS